MDIKASLLCYWQRLEGTKQYKILHFKNEVIKNQQCVKNTRSSIKQQLQIEDWLKAQNDISDSSRQKYTKRTLKKITA